MATTKLGVKYTPMSTSEANTCFKAYYEDAPVYRNKIKGVVINRDQVNAIKELDDYFSEKEIICEGYRVYHGIYDESSGDGVPPQRIALLVGIDEHGNDITSHEGDTCIRACDGNARTWGNCPTVCDDDSPITEGAED